MSSLWNKLTDVVIGFGLHGPKADLLENIQLSYWGRLYGCTIPVGECGNLCNGAVF
jgi:hypothetical protein